MPMRNLLVVAIGEDRPNAGLFERIVVKKLTTRGNQATALMQRIGTSTELTRELVIAEAKAIAADAVLVTRLKSMQFKQKQKKDPLSTYREGYSDGIFFHFEYAALTAPIDYKTTADIVLTSRLYRVDDGLRIWRIDTKGHSDELSRNLMFENAELIVTQMVKDELIK